jgi:hypothetical protein
VGRVLRAQTQTDGISPVGEIRVRSDHLKGHASARQDLSPPVGKAAEPSLPLKSRP